jgi:pyruvate/2-oxoglutarate dehydrogenase complex dihydrolipoamide dehydrogenase (E3) component
MPDTSFDIIIIGSGPGGYRHSRRPEGSLTMHRRSTS